MFANSSEVIKAGMPVNWKSESRVYDFFDKIQGIDIIDRKNVNNKFNQCDGFVFQNDKWYQDCLVSLDIQQKIINENSLTVDENASASKFIKMREELLGKDFQSYLIDKGYELIENPEPDCLVVYLNKDLPQHYGKVAEVNEDSVIIESKFSTFYTYRHKIEIAPFIYGNEVIYLKKSP